jgi:DNA helicase-2/ATP-dependent DNA helicase PcrA
MDDLFSAAAVEGHSVDTYQRVLDGLSEAQRRAVIHEDGPLIVLAGPGTGKTRVITARVAYMIGERGIAADRIAAVTFTNKAARELGNRLGELVDPTVAERVHATTFHSLGFRIVRRFADVLGLPSNFQIIDSAQRNRLIREIIRDERLYRDSLGSGISAAVDQAHRVMESLRHLGLESSDAREWLTRAREEAESIDGDEQSARVAELDRFGDAVGVYGHFQTRCLDRGWVVIDDLIMMPTRLVREHDSVASILRHDYGHLVVDEFQDVNQAQIEMIRALCPPSDRADVCVVGDDDQSIYGFRGADDRAFARFASVWQHSTTVKLTTNYRSARVIVDAGNASITRAASRFAPDKTAVAHRGDIAGSSLELVKLDDNAQTGEVIASMLLAMASDGGEGFSFSDCAVIARSNPFLEEIAQTLMLEGIPIDMREKASSMEDEGAKDVFAWARLLIDPDSSVELRRVLSRPPYRVDPVVLGSLISGYKAARSRFEHREGDKEKDPGTLIGWVVDRSEGVMRERVEAMRGLMQELGLVVSQQPAAEAVTEIIKRTGVVHRDLGDARSRSKRISAVSSIVKFARLRGDRFDSPGDLGAMLRYFDDLDEKEQSLGELPEDVVAAYEGDGALGGSDRGAVSLLTAHTSKGLEFKTVFVARVGNYGFPLAHRGEDGVLPDGVMDRGDDVRDSKSRHADEERRVFFVALTRAEDRAILTAKLPKKTTVANYAFELRESMGERLIERDVEDVTDLERAGDAVSRLSAEFKAIRSIRDAFDQAKREARRDAASAIDAHELGEIDRDSLVARLGSAADRAAAVHEVLRTGVVPEWVADDSLGGGEVGWGT